MRRSSCDNVAKKMYNVGICRDIIDKPGRNINQRLSPFLVCFDIAQYRISCFVTQSIPIMTS